MTEIINIKGYKVEISHDDWQENPREWGCSSTLVTAHQKYTFGGIQLTRHAFSIEDAFQKHLADVGLSYKDIIYREVFMYEHSGIALSMSPFGCRFDSGQLGYIYEKRSAVRAEFGVKRISRRLKQQILNRLESEIEILGYWANGEVYCFSVGEETYGGFYGCDHYRSGLIEAAAEAVDHLHKETLTAHFKKLKQLIKAGVALKYRPVLRLPSRAVS